MQNILYVMCCFTYIFHIIILYYILKHIGSGSQLKSIQCLIKAPRLSDGLLGKHSYSRRLSEYCQFIPSYSNTNINLEYNFLLAKKDSRHILSSLFIDYFHSQRSIWVVTISLEETRRKNCLVKMCCFISRNPGEKMPDFSHA